MVWLVGWFEAGGFGVEFSLLSISLARWLGNYSQSLVCDCLSEPLYFLCLNLWYVLFAYYIMLFFASLHIWDCICFV